eukprot:3312616-Prymnesium_polylepis.1
MATKTLQRHQEPTLQAIHASFAVEFWKRSGTTQTPSCVELSTGLLCGMRQNANARMQVDRAHTSETHPSRTPNANARMHAVPLSVSRKVTSFTSIHPVRRVPSLRNHVPPDTATSGRLPAHALPLPRCYATYDGQKVITLLLRPRFCPSRSGSVRWRATRALAPSQPRC